MDGIIRAGMDRPVEIPEFDAEVYLNSKDELKKFVNAGYDQVISVYGIAGAPLSVRSTNGVFHNDPVFDSHTAPLDRRGDDPPYWPNQWDTYVTIGVTDARDDCTAISPGFGAETNDLAADWSSENAGWFE